MEIEYRLKLGNNEFTLRFNAEDEKEVFQKLSFFSTMPKVGPNGEEDLRLSFQKNKEGNEFYSIVSEQAGMEYKYGQRKSDKGLFPKGWEPSFKGSQNGEEQASAPVIGSAPVAAKTLPKPTPVKAPQKAAVPAVVSAPVKAAPVQEEAPAAAPVTENKDVQSILSKYGIRR